MGMTMTQKILAAAAGKHEVKEGELIMAKLKNNFGKMESRLNKEIIALNKKISKNCKRIKFYI